MPLYEYGCEQCGKRFEVQQKLADAPLKTCPTCGADALEKIISATSFVLKGGGWYKDGYGNPQKPRTENQRTDRLQKAIDDDKKKTATPSAAPAGESSSSSGSATGGTSSGGASSAGGGSSTGGSTT